jgi:hypothetical protein
MAIQTNQPQDARRRTDDFEREYIATAGGNTPVMDTTVTGNGKTLDVTNRLLHQLEKSAQSLRHVGESVENRGLKLLLKVMAQERASMYNALHQALGQGVSDALDPANKSSATSMQQGLQDIQTSMTVQRQGRENIALSHFVEEEEELLGAYSAALEQEISASLRSQLELQRAHVAQFYARLQSVGIGIDPIVARVFDTRIEGESAITRLRERGLDAAQIDAAPITRVAQPLLRANVSSASPKNTMAAGAFSGAVVGGLVGLALAAFVWLAPQLVGWVTVGPWALLIGAIVIGAVFGSVFGLLIGQSQREDDLAVTADGLINGEILVVAYPQPQQVALAEEILQVHHARELNR